ncbi:MAG TPA: histidine phosphatase family protein [Dehalococcoidia bacterium]|nr:histidine phosphatase family protein [Dehalococcoidia bacterium]
MAKLILARHGETVWNVEKIYRGRMDVNLDEVGIKQAELLGKYLSNWKLEAIYSSPVKRAIDTANIVARYQKIGVHIAEGLIDFDYGEWQSLPEQEVKRLYPALLNEWHHNPHKVRMPGGESLEDVGRRAIEVVNYVLSKYQGSVVLVSHRVVNKVLICSLLGLDNSHFWNINQDVGGITIFNYVDGRFVLTRHNDTSHLRELQKSILDDF